MVTVYEVYDNIGSVDSAAIYGASVNRAGIKIGTSSKLKGVTVSKIKIGLRRAGTPTGAAYIRLRDGSDNIVATLYTIADVGTIGTSSAYYEYTFTKAVTLLAGYRLTFEYGGGDAANNIIIYNGKTAADTFDAAETQFTSYNGSYTDDATADFGCTLYAKSLLAKSGSTEYHLTDTATVVQVYGAVGYKEEKLASTSGLIGVHVNALAFPLKKVGAPTGNLVVEIRDSGGAVVRTIATIDVSKLSTTVIYKWLYGFETVILDSGYSVRFSYSGGDGSNYVAIYRSTADAFDGTNTYFNDNGTPQTAQDLSMTLTRALGDIYRVKDRLFDERANSKGFAIGTATELLALTEFYPGMGFYVSVAGSGYIADVPIIRNVANDGWTKLVTETGAQTLLNKTLTTPTINGATLSGTLAGAPTMTGNWLWDGATVTVRALGDANKIVTIDTTAAITAYSNTVGGQISAGVNSTNRVGIMHDGTPRIWWEDGQNDALIFTVGKAGSALLSLLTTGVVGFGSTWKLKESGGVAQFRNFADNDYYDIQAKIGTFTDVRPSGNIDFSNGSSKLIYTTTMIWEESSGIVAVRDSGNTVYNALKVSDLTASGQVIASGSVRADGATDLGAAFNFPDVSGYVLSMASTWGLYWDTTANSFNFRGGGTDRFVIDLDNGALTVLGNMSIAANKILTGNVALYQRSTNNQAWMMRSETATNYTALQIAPNGAGNGGVRSDISIFGTDIIADATNYERMYIRAVDPLTSGYVINVEKSGTGTVRQLFIQIAGVNMINFNTDNTMNFNSKAIANAVFTDVIKINSSSDSLLDWQEGGANRWRIAYSVAGNYLYVRDIQNSRDLINLTDTGSVIFANVSGTNRIDGLFQLEQYMDIKRIASPADPASGYGRLYIKQIDANNDGLYIRMLKNGAMQDILVA